jgi:hypothetical protein
MTNRSNDSLRQSTCLRLPEHCSRFNRSFTPPALINGVVDRNLNIIPYLLGSRPLYLPRNPRNPIAVDPAIERARHYVGCGNTANVEPRSSPVWAPFADVEWTSDEEESFRSPSGGKTVPSFILVSYVKSRGHDPFQDRNRVSH